MFKFEIQLKNQRVLFWVHQFEGGYQRNFWSCCCCLFVLVLVLFWFFSNMNMVLLLCLIFSNMNISLELLTSMFLQFCSEHLYVLKEVI